jgi:TonB-dependent starch-binding outer membrane protein SusC
VSSGNEFSYDYLLEDGTYAKIDELLIGYRFPGTMRWLAQTGLESGRIAVVGRNLYSFTNYTGYDPEIQAATVRRDDNGYPRYRTVTFQLELVF